MRTLSLEYGKFWIHVYTYGKHIICIIYGYILILYGLLASNWPLIPFKYFLIGRKAILYMIKVGLEQNNFF